jgi:uncharacterized protein (DUF1778 family)
MAKKKVARKMSSNTQERRSVAVTLKGTEEWKDWLEQAADHCRVTVSAFIDFAAAEYAKAHGFKKEPPKR